ncbi:ADP-ribosylation factor-like protein [Rickettsiella endosymbiont of Dermanyssus gallinae]|uniref:ADP-ribosylation factor-like protein n=1 Tax=Rickettsiella endosymbiont of Dermanyssus gallinae TaxID=2856608 RepID=UPI001C5312C9|nr:ADP-ribosylation factor-like protein [Rickettsiella endosymbiont of Dermanyssus gallinae]
MSNNIKVVFLGAENVGKTSLLNRMKNRAFSDRVESTIGSSFSKLTEGTVIFDVWDVAGAERYRGLWPMYHRSSSIIVYVLSSTEDIEKNKKLLQQYRQATKSNSADFSELIVFAKSDHLESRLSEEYIRAFDAFELPSIACSAKDNSTDQTGMTIKDRLMEYFNKFASEKIAYDQILTYLNLPVFDEKEIKEKKHKLSELVQKKQAGSINPDRFKEEATVLIQQIREQVPKQSLAWRLLDAIASLIAIIVPPIAIANCFYNKAVNGKFELSFFKSPEEKSLNRLEVWVDKVRGATIIEENNMENSNRA